jgi:hypothetical protein
MIRLIHNQTVQGAILVDDIDDGLPNKEVHRLGSLGDPKAYERDGYANKPKQPCYVPYSHTAPNGSIVAGFITLQQTNKVTQSAASGKISKLVLAGLLTEVSGKTATDFAVPDITASAHGVDPVVVTGTTFLSVLPDITTISFTQGTGLSAPTRSVGLGGGPATFTAAQVTAGSGTVNPTTFSIPAAMFTQVPVAGNYVVVTSNEQNSNTFTMT